MPEPEVELGRRIRSARWALGWKQADLAERLGVAVKTISAIETGDRKRFSRDELIRYEEVLGITDSRLLAALGFVAREGPGTADSPPSKRRTMSYGGQSLTGEQEQEVLEYIEWIRTRDQAG